MPLLVTVHVVGSYLLGTCTRYNKNVDVAVEMPSACFQAKDHLNNKYFAKRACYLSVVAAALRRDPAFANTVFSVSSVRREEKREGERSHCKDELAEEDIQSQK